MQLVSSCCFERSCLAQDVLIRGCYLGYVGPHSTSQQFLMMFLWLYGFWTLFFPDQDPLIWANKQKKKIKNAQHPSVEQPNLHNQSVSIPSQTHPNHRTPLLGSLSGRFSLRLYLIQKQSSIFRCYSHRLGFDLLKGSCQGFNDSWFNGNCVLINAYQSLQPHIKTTSENKIIQIHTKDWQSNKQSLSLCCM